MARPRKADKLRVLGPLGEASSRLQLLEKAGLTPERCAELLRIFVEEAESTLRGAMSPLNPTQPDHHARMSAGAKILQLIGANPPKSTSSAPSGPQVVVVNEVPAWAREPRPVQAQVVDAQPSAPALGAREPEAGAPVAPSEGPRARSREQAPPTPQN